jgi:redox-sensitive bicupin YhaK (pirin superfamily)
LLTSPDGGSLLRIIAGEVDGHRGPGITYSPISVVHATIQPGAEVDIPWRPDFNALVYVLSGSGYVAAERRPIRDGQLAVLGAGDAIRVGALRGQDSRAPALDVYVMGGLPIGEPVAWYGPFVMNTHEELARAFDDYRTGRLGTIPAGSLTRNSSSIPNT